MSTGADCIFVEKKDGWYYDIQTNYDTRDEDENENSFEEDPEYNTHGPFSSKEKAISHLDGNYANPGGWSVYPLKAGA